MNHTFKTNIFIMRPGYSSSLHFCLSLSLETLIVINSLLNIIKTDTFSILRNQNFCSILLSVYQNLIRTASDNLSRNNTQPFSTWCPLKGHTYLNKPAAFSCRFVKVRVTFQWTLGTTGLNNFLGHPIILQNNAS